MLLLALTAPAQTRTVTWPDGWFSIEVPAAWDWYEEKEFESGGDVGWVALAPHWEDGFVVIELKTERDQPLDRLTAFAARSAAEGATMSKPVMQRTKDGLRITFTTKKTERVTYHFVYIVGRRHRVTLEADSPKNAEPASLRRAVVSLRWLKAP